MSNCLIAHLNAQYFIVGLSHTYDSSELSRILDPNITRVILKFSQVTKSYSSRSDDSVWTHSLLQRTARIQLKEMVRWIYSIFLV